MLSEKEKEILKKYDNLLRKLDIALPFLCADSEEVLKMDIYHYLRKMNTHAAKLIIDEMEMLKEEYNKQN